jgi:hypothetical protein
MTDFSKPTPRGVSGDRESRYENMFPRLLNAVTGMASGTGSLRARLALAVADVCVFHEDNIPSSVRDEFRQFCELVASPTVHPAYLAHPDPVKSCPAFYLTPAKARRAAELLTSMLETVAWRRGWTEEELRQVEDDEARRAALGKPRELIGTKKPRKTRLGRVPGKE